MAALEPGAAPAGDRQMRHIGVDLDPRHQAAPEPEPAGDIVVVDLVLGLLGGVDGGYAIGAGDRLGHGSSSRARI